MPCYSYWLCATTICFIQERDRLARAADPDGHEEAQPTGTILFMLTPMRAITILAHYSTSLPRTNRHLNAIAELDALGAMLMTPADADHLWVPRVDANRPVVIMYMLPTFYCRLGEVMQA